MNAGEIFEDAVMNFLLVTIHSWLFRNKFKELF